MNLSILVPSVSTRRKTFLPKALDMLYSQLEGLSEEDQKKVEILFLVDNKKMMLGNKRNNMISLAQGKYIQFVDDDDRISDDFIKVLLDATESDADCIVFQAEVTINDQEPKRCYYSKDNRHDFNRDNAFYRIPNHICCVKKEISQKSSFPNIMYGEDSGYSKVLLPHLKTEYKIDRVLYYYDYNIETSETQQYMPNRSKINRQQPIVDVVILSKANNFHERSMTQTAVRTCLNGANGLPVGITVLEQGVGKYRGAHTINKPEQFNYNRFANYGASLGTAEWIMIANNDLVFTDGWLHMLLAANHPIVSPHEPNDARQRDIEKNEKGYENGKHFSGWCFMIKRSLWRQIGRFDDCVDFWFSDDVVIEQLKQLGVKPMIVKDSIVNHLVSKTLRTIPNQRRQELMWRNADIFNKKYKQKKFVDDPRYLQWAQNNKSKEL